MSRPPSAPRVGEHRWPPAIALVAALALYASLPSDFLSSLRVTVVAIGAALLIVLLTTNPVRFTRQTAWSRNLSVAQALFLTAANQVALLQLVMTLVQSGSDSGPRLLVSAGQVWLVNVVAIALLLWELDRGGPVVRSMEPREKLPRADLRFAQDEDRDTIDEVRATSSSASDWRPVFGDYLYTSISNSMAFSTSDSMPLTLRAKAILGLQAFSGFVLLALVIARAVSLFA